MKPSPRQKTSTIRMTPEASLSPLPSHYPHHRYFLILFYFSDLVSLARGLQPPCLNSDSKQTFPQPLGPSFLSHCIHDSWFQWELRQHYTSQEAPPPPRVLLGCSGRGPQALLLPRCPSPQLSFQTPELPKHRPLQEMVGEGRGTRYHPPSGTLCGKLSAPEASLLRTNSYLWHRQPLTTQRWQVPALKLICCVASWFSPWSEGFSSPEIPCVCFSSKIKYLFFKKIKVSF